MSLLKKTSSHKWFPWTVLVLAGVVIAFLAITSHRQFSSAMAESAFCDGGVQWPIDPEDIGMPHQSRVEILQFEGCQGFRLAQYQFLVSIQTELDYLRPSDVEDWGLRVRKAVDQIAPDGRPAVPNDQVGRMMAEAIYEALKYEQGMGVSMDDIVIKPLDSLDRSRGVMASSV